MRAAALLPLLSALLPAPAAGSECVPAGELAVTGLGTLEHDAARLAELSGAVAPAPRLIGRGGQRAEITCAGADFPWPARGGGARGGDAGALRIEPLPIRLATTWNSTYPSGQNDGLMWAGRGVSQSLSLGVLARRGAVSVALAPEVAWAENRAFELVPSGLPGDLRFSNPFYGAEAIDLPQRMGSGTWTAWAPGQSFVRADAWNVAVGLSTENLWFGPGIRSSILMSNAGPGFPHLFLGTSRPADVRIGEVEALLFWGRLERTRFVPNGGRPLVEGLVVDYAPRWIPGLSLGLARVFVKPWDGLVLRDYLAMFQTFEKEELADRYPNGDNPYDNQLASVFGRWAFPESGLEVYAEWAREDYNWTWWGTLREPDHSQAWLLGLQKAFRAGGRVVRLHAELLHLQEVRPPTSDAGMPVYYVHGNDLDYTNAGQLLGAWVGPGGDVQHLAVDVFHRGGRIGGYLERAARNEGYYWAVVEPAQGDFSHDAELTAALRQVLFAGRLEISWEAAASYRQNRDFLRHEPNLRLQLGLAVKP